MQWDFLESNVETKREGEKKPKLLFTYFNIIYEIYKQGC